MATVSYNSVLFTAAEIAGRDRSRINNEDALMLQGFIDTSLQDLWNREAWPDLTPDPQPFVPVSGQILKTAGVLVNPFDPASGTVMGDILGVYRTNPLHSRHSMGHPMEWDEGNGTVRIYGPQLYLGPSGAAWVEYMYAVPDLFDVA